MNSLATLKPLIGVRKTLVITCRECGLQGTEDFSGQVFTHSSLGATLQRHDYLQQESLEYFVGTKGCTQIIVAGHTHCHVMDTLKKDPFLGRTLHFNLGAYFKNPNVRVLSKTVRDQMLLELNIIDQCKLLLDYPFLRDRMRENSLHLMGVVMGNRPEQLKQVFYNNILYNTVIALN
ncbi:MAG TPA: carbonic anhydrase [Chryseolinea sp.]